MLYGIYSSTNKFIKLPLRLPRQHNLCHKRTIGEELKQSGKDLDFTYSGKWGIQKEEYNLYYMRDRYYSSELHRFLSLDKEQGDLYKPSTLNPYAYVGNDPINFIDPSGMTAVNIANALKNAVINEDGSLNWGGLFELGKLAFSFTPVGWAIDLYDLGKSILEFDWTWGGLADIGLNVVGLIPGVGDLAKASKLGKNAIKTVDAVADVTDGLNDARKAIKRTDALVDASKAAKNVGNGAEALDTANDARKALKNVDEVGSGAKLAKKGEETVSLYRGVSPEEFYDIMETKKFRTTLQSYEGKLFALNFEELLIFSDQPVVKNISAIIKIDIPKSMYERLYFKDRDGDFLRSGYVFVDEEILKELNKIVNGQIEHIF